MKIFFNASLRGKREYADNYTSIYDAIEKARHEIVAAPATSRDIAKVVKDTDTQEATNYYKELLSWIKKADVCVFEVSYPSTSIGHEVALSLQFSKPVVALHTKKAPRNLVLQSIDDERLQLIDYEPGRVDAVVKDAIEYAAEQVDTRFNFFISPAIGAHLDSVAKNRKVPRAVYLRQLIEEDMVTNEEYES